MYRQFAVITINVFTKNSCLHECNHAPYSLFIHMQNHVQARLRLCVHTRAGTMTPISAHTQEREVLMCAYTCRHDHAYVCIYVRACVTSQQSQ
jgi:hypothetical protein